MISIEKNNHTRNCMGISSTSMSAIVIFDGGFVLIVGDWSTVVWMLSTDLTVFDSVSSDLLFNSFEGDDFRVRWVRLLCF